MKEEWRKMTVKLDEGLDAVQTSPLRTEVANLLRKHILNGDIQSGERLIEVEIAQQLGVSRMPVREALRVLESEGLIKQIPRKGIVVSEYTEDDIIEYYTIREALEICAIKIVIDKITKDEIDELKMYCSNAVKAHRENDTDKVCFWTSKFNERIYDSCGMPRLKEQISSTQKYLRTFRMVSFREPNRTEKALAEHLEIIQLVESKNIEGAVKATSAHLKDAREAYLSLWKRTKGKI